jgi:hypothetical protein
MQTQIVALSADDMPLIASAPIRPGERPERWVLLLT